MTGQRLRPMALGDIVDEGFDLYKRNFTFFVTVSALIMVPAIVAVHFLNVALGHGGLDWDSLAGTAPSDPTAWSSWVLEKLPVLIPIWLANQTVSILTMAALSLAASSAYLGSRSSTSAVFITLFKRLFRLCTNLVMASLLTAFSTLICFFPGIVVYNLSLFTVHAIMIENAPGLIGGIKRSWKLEKGYGLRTFGCLLVLLVLYAILKVAITGPFTYAFLFVVNTVPGVGDLSGTLNHVGGVAAGDPEINSVANGVASLLVMPFIISVLTVFYYDLRVRNEAFDVDVLARELNFPPLSSIPYYLPSSIPRSSGTFAQMPVRPAKASRKRNP